MEFTRKDFGLILGSRGIPWGSRDVWEQELVRYAPGDPDGAIRRTMYEGVPHDISQKALDAAYRLCVERSRRAPGVMMCRHAVPGADPFIFAEMRPDHPILTGGPEVHRHRSLKRTDRREHVEGDRTTRKAVVEGCTPAELDRFRRLPGWDLTEGADHAGDDPGVDTVHVHLNVPKYLFPRNQRVSTTVKHDHSEHRQREMTGHLFQEHGYPRYTYSDSRRQPQDQVARDLLRLAANVGQNARSVEWDENTIPAPDEEHTHRIRRDRTFYARRLSSHPLGLARIPDAQRVLFIMEGELKEAAAVAAGEATISVPSVTLWDCRELPTFTRRYLRGKLVLVVPDSDWNPAVRRNRDDAVYRQAILLRERLKRYGARAFVAAPPHPEDCAKRCSKHGLDDHLAHGVTGRRPGTVDELVWVDVEAQPQGTLEAWYEEHDVRGEVRRLRSDRIERDEAVLKWLSLLADEDGSTPMALGTLSRYVRQDLRGREGKPVTEASARQRTWDAVWDMYDAGVLDGVDGLGERVNYHIGLDVDWAGTITIADPDLRAWRRMDGEVGDLAR
jgi:hypothetical protein